MVHVLKSTRPITEKEINREWHLIDVNGKVVGREVPRIVELLQGKHKVTYAPYLDMGDNVVVINVKGVKMTGKKEQEKEYLYYSGYQGGQKTVTFKRMKIEKPGEIIRHAVTGMLPKNKLRDKRLARLHVYEGDVHPFADKFSK
jgi:large subunit ribosomal protein L13